MCPSQVQKRPDPRGAGGGYPSGVREWLPRAGLMMLVHVAARTALGFAALSWPTSGQLQRIIGFVVVVIAALWSGLDTLRENLADDERAGLTQRWLTAAVVAGPVAGLVGWAIEGLFIDSIGTSALAGDIIGGGAFTALLIFVPAVVGMMFGRLARTDRARFRRSVSREPSV